MSQGLLRTAGIIFIILPTVMYGGVTLLRFITKRDPGYMDNPVRQNLWRAGHAHAGVLLVLALVGLLYAEAVDATGIIGTAARSGIPVAAILMPAGFFFSSMGAGRTGPNRAILLVYLGAVSLALGLIALGVTVLAG
jgi:hypothetical protein